MKNSGARVLTALNSWLVRKGQLDIRHCMVTTFSALVLKSTPHICSILAIPASIACVRISCNNLHRIFVPAFGLEKLPQPRAGIDYHLDFGSVKIAGIEDISTPVERLELLGTKNYTAPEYLLGTAGRHRSDLFSLGVICYEVLTGQLPYSERLTQNLNSKTINRINYTSAIVHNPMIPQWLDGALEKALSLVPRFRYDTLSELLFDLTHPNTVFMNRSAPLYNKHPNTIWKILLLTSAVFNQIFIYLLLH